MYFWNSETGESQWDNPWQKAMSKFRAVNMAFSAASTSTNENPTTEKINDGPTPPTSARSQDTPRGTAESIKKSSDTADPWEQRTFFVWSWKKKLESLLNKSVC